MLANPYTWGFMIQFDLRIFFRWVGKNTPPPTSYQGQQLPKAPKKWPSLTPLWGESWLAPRAYLRVRRRRWAQRVGTVELVGLDWTLGSGTAMLELPISTRPRWRCVVQEVGWICGKFWGLRLGLAVYYIRFCWMKLRGFFLKVSLLSHFPFIGFFSKNKHQPPWNHGIFHFRGLDELMALRILEVMMCCLRGRYVFLVGWNFGIDGSEGDKIDYGIIFPNFRGAWYNLGASSSSWCSGTGYFVVRRLGPWEGLVCFHHFLRFLAKVRLWKPLLHGVGHENFGEKVGWSTHGMLWFPLATDLSEPFWVCGFS